MARSCSSAGTWRSGRNAGGAQQQATRSRRGRGASRSVIKKWEEKETKELSRLVLDYKRRRGKLPETSDKVFWVFCCELLEWRFTVHQVREKMRRLKLRYLRVSSGLAKSIKLSEKETFNIWAVIMLDHTTPSSSSSPLAPWTSPPPTPPAVVADEGENQTAPDQLSTGTNAAQPQISALLPPHNHESEHNRGGAHGNDPRAKDKPASRNHNEGVDEQSEAASTCSMDSHTGKGFNSGGAYAYGNVNFENDVAFDATPDVGGESIHHKTLLHHTTVADLASTAKVLAETTRLLAEIVHSYGPPPPMF